MKKILLLLSFSSSLVFATALQQHVLKTATKEFKNILKSGKAAKKLNYDVAKCFQKGSIEVFCTVGKLEAYHTTGTVVLKNFQISSVEKFINPYLDKFSAKVEATSGTFKIGGADMPLPHVDIDVPLYKDKSNRWKIDSVFLGKAEKIFRSLGLVK